jgi:hypothetical protein
MQEKRNGAARRTAQRADIRLILGEQFLQHTGGESCVTATSPDMPLQFLDPSAPPP